MAPVARPVLWSVVVGSAVMLTLLPRGHAWLPTYSTVSPRLAAAEVVAALALLTATVVGLLLDPTRPGLVALALAAPVWTVQDWAGWYDGPGFAPTAAIVLAPLLVPLPVHAVLAAAHPHRRVPLSLVALYVVAGVVALVHALFDDPFLDRDCWSTCLTTNVLLVSARPDVVHGVALVWLLVTATVGLALVGLAVRWAWVATRAGLRMRGPAIVAGFALGGVLLAQSVARWRRPRVDPGTSLDAGLYLALAAALVLVSAGWAAGPLLDRWTRRGVAQLVTGLGDAAAAGTVARVIAAATGDPSVRVVYRLPAGGYADAAGRFVDAPRPGPGALPVLRDGHELALVLHDPDATGPDGIRAALGTALTLALDNERLRVEGLAQLAELEASRARVVETGDAERRQLERNLHDGAQQQMLALAFDLRRAVANAHTPDACAVLTSAEAEARAALTELRELAHGIHPAVLEEAGLVPALATLADGAPVSVKVQETLGGRLPPGVERTAYVVVRDAVAAAAATGSPGVDVTLTEADGDLVVEVRGAGPGPFGSVEDRVAGARGHVALEPDRLRAVIPCVS
ncbi:hypothetical protein GCM10009798_13610 [Nocardioides panacihumi]|uniref:histidine kinase n=1 Tax=Nocardioides panacihumi TaxID=400774 RepID=A0ABN2QNH1_9ACTN